jgi:copper chaperone CopZ
MSTVSKLPGRLRLEIKELINKRCHCRVTELKILEIKGVMEAEANHRTGRLLAVFDEAVVDSHELVSKIREILDEMVECHDSGYETQNVKRNNSIANGFVHAVIDIAGHALMPKPLGILVPIAINAMRKNF